MGQVTTAVSSAVTSAITSNVTNSTAIVPSALDQVASIVTWSGFNSRTVTINNVTAGATILLVNCMCNFAGSSIGCSTVNDGNAYTKDGVSLLGFSGEPLTVEVWRLHNASAGSHSIVCTSTQANANNFGRLQAFSITGLLSAVPDVTQPNSANSATPATGASATLNQSGEFIVAAMVISSSLTSPTFTQPANTGYTNLYNTTVRSDLPASIDYKHVTTQAAQSADWGTNTAGAERWSALLVTYKDASS